MDNDPRFAALNVTFNGQQGDIAEPVLFDSSDEQVRAIATEAVRAGGVRGIDAHPTADFTDFVVDRVAAHDGLPDRLILRPKTPFGGYDGDGRYEDDDGDEFDKAIDADEDEDEDEDDDRDRDLYPDLTPRQEGVLHLAVDVLHTIPAHDGYGAKRPEGEILGDAVHRALALIDVVKQSVR